MNSKWGLLHHSLQACPPPWPPHPALVLHEGHATSCTAIGLKSGQGHQDYLQDAGLVSLFVTLFLRVSMSSRQCRRRVTKLSNERASCQSVCFMLPPLGLFDQNRDRKYHLHLYEESRLCDLIKNNTVLKENVISGFSEQTFLNKVPFPRGNHTQQNELN